MMAQQLAGEASSSLTQLKLAASVRLLADEDTHKNDPHDVRSIAGPSFAVIVT